MSKEPENACNQRISHKKLFAIYSILNFAFFTSKSKFLSLLSADFMLGTQFLVSGNKFVRKKNLIEDKAFAMTKNVIEFD